MHATRPTSPAALAMDLMRPSEILAPPAPATDDPRRWLRVVLRALLVLANVAAAAILLGVALR
jgi:hypothetical protein